MNNALKVAMISLLVMTTVSATDWPVPIGDPVYDFLERQTVRGSISDFSNDTRPLPRRIIAGYLARLDAIKTSLGPTDRALLVSYLTDYRSEFEAGRHPLLPEHGNRYCPLTSCRALKQDLIHRLCSYREEEPAHLFIYEDDANRVWLDLEGLLRLETKSGLTRELGMGGMRLVIQLGSHLSLGMSARGYLWRIPTGFTDFPPEVRNTYIQDEPTYGAQYFDDTGAFFRYYHPVAGTFGLNHETACWGNSPNSLILSDNIAPFGSVQWQKDFDRARYTFIHGNIQGIRPDFDPATHIKSFPRKYFVGHRLDTTPTTTLHLAFTEMIIYGNRNFEPDYLLPVSLLYTMEHEQRDRDNNLMAFEGEWFPVNGLKAYGTLLIDELAVRNIGKKWWAHKHGYQAGLLWALKIPTTLRIEWTAVRPWTYTHKIDVNSYTHNGECIGFYAGPNSRLWYIENRWWYGKRLSGVLEFRLLNHGEDPLPVTDPNYFPAGGDANQDYSRRNPDDDFNTRWLMGDIITTRSLAINFAYRWRRELYYAFGLLWQQKAAQSEIFGRFEIRMDF